jgi:hypothetical protein
MRRAAAALLLCLTSVAGATPSAWLERVDRALFVESPNGTFRADLSGLVDLEGYYIDQRPPGLIFSDDRGFFNPRLTLFLDTRLGRHLYGFVQARLDRGFDPGAESVDARFDEYLLRYTPFADPRLNLQVGKFATVVGNWVPRHDSWNNPFINAPLPYENVTIVSDAAVAGDPDELLARRTVPDKKDAWLPLVWGPSYATGAAAFGRIARFDYAVEVKNAALPSRPHEWDARHRAWDDPTASARLGVRPAPAWAIGTSASAGSYLREGAATKLPPGKDVGEFREFLVGLDASYARHRLQLWGEFFAARFELPNRCGPRLCQAIDDADTIAYYLEARYKLTTELFAALRWNQQLFDDIEDSAGRARRWDRDIWRVDTALTYRFDRHLQAKLQYGYGRQTGGLQQGEQLVAAQVTVRF